MGLQSKFSNSLRVYYGNSAKDFSLGEAQKPFDGMNGVNWFLIIDGMTLLYWNTDPTNGPVSTVESISERLHNYIRSLALDPRVSNILIMFDKDTPSQKLRSKKGEEVEETPVVEGLRGERAWKFHFETHGPVVKRVMGDGSRRDERVVEVTSERLRNREFKRYLISLMCQKFRRLDVSLRAQNQNPLTVCVRGHGDNNFELVMENGEIREKEPALYSGYYMEAEVAISGAIRQNIGITKNFIVLSNDGDTYGPLMLVMPFLYGEKGVASTHKVDWIMNKNRYSVNTWHGCEELKCHSFGIGFDFVFSFVNYSIVILAGGNDYVSKLPSISVEKALAGCAKSSGMGDIYRRLIIYEEFSTESGRRPYRLSLDPDVFADLVRIIYSGKPNQPCDITQFDLDTRRILLEWYLQYILAGLFGAREYYPPYPSAELLDLNERKRSDSVVFPKQTGKSAKKRRTKE